MGQLSAGTGYQGICEIPVSERYNLKNIYLWEISVCLLELI